MTARLATQKPFPYQSQHNPLLHAGVVEVPATGTLTVNLGVGHNNFTPALSIKGGIAALAAAKTLAWEYGTTPGSFVITVGKATSSAVTTVILATTATTVSFTATVGAAI